MPMPGRCKARSPGWILVRVVMLDGDRVRDQAEAAETFADKPWAADARYLGVALGWHLFERPGSETS